ncbi:Detected protein of unknown function [Hibiscus syriacus]|uniref:Uncharacterized protein n=1 Tax=Hibiscus syriacus TaxID=106335 RepID=A0A6A2Y0G4_HIBSY|nr:Detected protein of unknown function [Hibiscus syriacus]
MPGLLSHGKLKLKLKGCSVNRELNRLFSVAIDVSRTHPADVQVLKDLKNGVDPPSISPDLDRALGISPLTHATTSSLITSLAASGVIHSSLGDMPEEEYYMSQGVRNTKSYFETPNDKLFTQSFLPLDKKVKASIYMTHGYGSDTGRLFQKICISFSTWGYVVFIADIFGHGIYDGLHCYLVPPNTVKKKRRCRKRKMTLKNRMSTSSAESRFFTSGSFEDYDINDRETKTLVSSSRSFFTDSPSKMFNTNLKVILETKPTRQNKKKPKKIKKTRRYTIRFSSSESESPARLSSFLQRMIPCTVDDILRESFVVVKK